MIFFIILHREQITRCLTIKIRIVMKKIMMTLVAMLTIAASGKAMSYEQARNEALFLTDKMAYELNLTDEQYEAAYEINLDYLMGVTSYDDVFGVYWERRNLDLSYVLIDWQWELFRAATYFYRPLYWEGGYWHFGIYARYPHRDYFYFGRPHFYATYRGGHSWHMNGGHSYYHGRADHFRPALANGRQHFGMRNGFDRGDYRGGRGGSSTRVTGRQDRRIGDRPNRGDVGGNRNGNYEQNRSGRFGGSRSSGNIENRNSNSRPSGNVGNIENRGNRPSGSVGNDANRPSGSSATPSRSFGGSRPSGSVGSSNRPSGSVERSSGSIGSSRPSSTSATPSRSFGGSRPSSSVGSRPSGGSSAASRPSSSASRPSSSMGSRPSGGSSTRSAGSSSGSRGHFGGSRSR